MIGWMVTLAMAAAPVPPTACGLDRLAGCRDTNALVLDPRFNAALKSFLGTARGSYLYDDKLVFDQIGEALGGPPDDARRLASGDWFFTACRAHSCQEKGAIVIAPTGVILATGLLSYDCHRTPPGQPACEKGPTLTIFVPRMAGAARASFMTALTEWATAGAAADRKGLGTIFAPFQGVVTRGILDERDDARRNPTRRTGG